MPITKERRKLYPPKAEWQAIRAAILTRAGNCCEGSPHFPACRAENGKPHPVTGAKVVLTIAHWPDPTPGNTTSQNLFAWCARCHNSMDARMRAENRRKTLATRDASLSLPLEEP